MKLTNVFYLSILLSLTFACGPAYNDSYAYQDEYMDQYYGEESPGEYYNEEAQGNYTEAAYQNYQDRGNLSTPVNQQSMMNSNQKPGPGFQPVKDQSGAVIGYMPLPQSWKIQDQIIQGPNGTTVHNYPMVTDQQGRFNSVDQVISQDVKPKLQQNGCTVSNIIDLPEVTRRDQQMASQLFQAMRGQDQHIAKGIEYTNNQGRKGLLVIHFINSRSNYGNFSMYTVNDLISNPGFYQEAKQTYLYALANQKFDQQYLARYNQKAQQQANASWSQHNQRMRNNQTAFESQNRAFNNSNNEVNDMIMDTWNNRNRSINEGHRNYIDGIRGVDRMVDPNSGQTFEANSGYNNYYLNNNGEYMGTNNHNYNPNLDPNRNNQDWRKAKKAPKRRW